MITWKVLGKLGFLYLQQFGIRYFSIGMRLFGAFFGGINTYVKFETDEQNEGINIKPKQNNYQGTNRTIELIVLIEIIDIN